MSSRAIREEGNQHPHRAVRSWHPCAMGSIRMSDRQLHRRDTAHITRRTFLRRHDIASESVILISRMLVRQGDMVLEQARPAPPVS
jgi:hypothetical protein